MARHDLFVALGGQRYRVERPWGDIPDGAGRLSDVGGDGQGRIYALLRVDPTTDPATPAVVVLAPDGRRLEAWGADDVADGHMLNVAPDGRVFVVDRDAHEIIVFDPHGKRLGGLGRRHRPGEPFNAPCDVAFAPDGTILVADGYGNSLVHRFSADGEPRGAWGHPGAGPGEFSTPHGLAVLPDGRVAVADRENNRVQVFAPDGTFSVAWSDHHKPMSVQLDTAGNLLVTDQVPRVSLLSPAGALLGRCRPVLNGAHGMWCDPSGVIYLSEQNPNRLTRLVPVASS